MTITLKDGYWTDEKFNKWSVFSYTEEEARICSASLKNCRNCESCRDCWGCENCRNCESCRNCLNCRSCRDCEICRDCYGCRDCWDCWNCYGCRDCKSCRKCDSCRSCRDCENCRICGNCQGCYGCRKCESCRKCRNCENCENCRGYTDNPLRFVGPRMGSRHDNPTIYWLGSNIQCVVGCFRGNLNALEAKVRETHASNPEHLNAYLQFITVARNLVRETSAH